MHSKADDLPLGLRLALLAYEGLFRAATPLLPRLAPRLKTGFDQRLLDHFPAGPFDLWMQAASGGAAYLALEIVARLPESVRTLVTTNTVQGREILEKGLPCAAPAPSVAYCPLDRPDLMRRALAMIRPKAVVLLETELWPGLLAACRQADVPVLVLNARMSERSFSRYRRFRSALIPLAPREVRAISAVDAARFRLVFDLPAERCGVMGNLKFDRLPGANSGRDADNPLAQVIPDGLSFAVLGSVRAEEEPEVLRAVIRLLEKAPGAVIGLFPRHMERVPAWMDLLRVSNIPHVARSSLDGPPQPGTVVLWDVFGELGHAYQQATAAFVGGSLAPLGGQNILEPLSTGLVPFSGPSRENFSWVAPELEAAGLVRTVTGGAQLGEALAAELVAKLAAAPTSQDKAAVRERFAAFVDPRRGAADKATARLAPYLAG